MAASIATTKSNGHSRSISLPTRTYPTSLNIEEHLCRLRSSESASSSSLPTNCNRLVALKGLYESVNEFLQLPSTQQNLSGCSEDVLGASLRLLDLCNTATDAVSQMRGSIQDLESSLRRRETDVSSNIKNYLICKNKVNKMVSNCFTSLKKLSSNNKNHETLAMVTMLREVQEVSVAIFESLFSFICPTSKQSSWSFVAKLTQSKSIQASDENISEVHKLHMDLEALYKQKSNKDSDISRIQEVQKCLMTLDTSMQQCEEDLDCLFRSLIKTRVSILNVVNH